MPLPAVTLPENTTNCSSRALLVRGRNRCLRTREPAAECTSSVCKRSVCLAPEAVLLVLVGELVLVLVTEAEVVIGAVCRRQRSRASCRRPSCRRRSRASCRRTSHAYCRRLYKGRKPSGTYAEPWREPPAVPPGEP